jgi:hypothetical protein
MLVGDRAPQPGSLTAVRINEVDGPHRRLMIASIRCLDRLVKIDGHWRFRQRKLMADWIDDR